MLFLREVVSFDPRERSVGLRLGIERLHAISWARYCIDCQEKFERGLLEE